MRRQRFAGCPAVLLCVWLVSGCGRPVVDPKGPGPLIPPPSSTGLPTLQTSGSQPALDVQPVPTESVIQLPTESQNETYHTVQTGETLASIAKRYGISVERLRTANGLDASAALQTQQLLFIPKDR